MGAMKTITKISTTTVDVPVAKVWKTLNQDFLDISRWASSVKKSEANPMTPFGFDGSAHGGRICEVSGIGTTDERVTTFDASLHMIGYTVSSENFPSFLSSMRNTWSVHSNGKGKSTIVVTITAQLRGVKGSIGAFAFGKLLGRAAKNLPLDLKMYLEGKHL